MQPLPTPTTPLPPGHCAELQRYVDEAVPFRPRPADRTQGQPAGRPEGRPLRVAATLVTCATAAAVLNELRLPPEPDCAYRYLNVHNPHCPLFHATAEQRWCCRPGLEDHPAWGFNWAGALLICRHLGGRLPLAEEWQCFASNNEPQRTYPWGEGPPSRQLANFGEHFGGPSRVRSFPPSELGLYDLAGNLDEWCLDSDSTAGRAGACEKVVKGGAWSKDPGHLRIAARRGKWARLGTTTIGLRPVWDDAP